MGTYVGRCNPTHRHSANGKQDPLGGVVAFGVDRASIVAGLIFTTKPGGVTTSRHERRRRNAAVSPRVGTRGRAAPAVTESAASMTSCNGRTMKAFRDPATQ